jgi:hypothetical protein
MLSTSPRITADENTLTARTSVITFLFTAGLAIRKLQLDRSARTLTIHDRNGWLFKRTRSIPFNQIRAVTYGYEDVNPSFGSHDAIDRFLVGIRLIAGNEIKLFSFIGDGSFSNSGPLPDWWYWEDILFDYTGPQENESRVFVQLLSKLIGVTIEPSTLTAET